MDNKRFVLALVLLSAGAVAALHIRGHADAGIQPVTITYHWVGYNGEDLSNPLYTRTEIVAVKADGSISRALRNGPTEEHKAWYGLKIADVTRGQYVVVDQFTESVTTYLTGAMVDQARVKPEVACPGEPSDPILGFATSVEEAVKQFPRSEMIRKTWRASKLNCLPLREEVRTEWADGSGRKSLKTVSATAVTLGNPESWLFNVPANYKERSPNEVFAEAARRQGKPTVELAKGLEEVYRQAQPQKGSRPSR
jgi:hypothetical protein